MDNFITLIPLYMQPTLQILVIMPYSLKTEKINIFCILSVINQTQHETLNINNNMWVISTLQDNEKLYITHLQYSYMIKFNFPYDIIYMPKGCKTNVITFVLPSSNKLNAEPSLEATEYKFGFNMSYSK